MMKGIKLFLALSVLFLLLGMVPNWALFCVQTLLFVLCFSVRDGVWQRDQNIARSCHADNKHRTESQANDQTGPDLANFPKPNPPFLFSCLVSKLIILSVVFGNKPGKTGSSGDKNNKKRVILRMSL